MAIIGSIRKRSGLLVAVIGLSILGFLLMDALNSNTSVLRGGRRDTLGKVNGEKILYADFVRRYEDAV
ncbi:MAG: SurA N-terminal domain-containing protein, partial [Chitinophagales bacterium]|nr:SurA N-terminal domain-containing protein [Chitinophagales bacterium]